MPIRCAGVPLEAARLVAAHNDFMVRAIEDEAPGVAAVRIPMAVEARPVGAYPVASLRARYGFQVDDVVVGVFGLLTREKQIETVARAVARAAATVPHLRLLLVGPSPEPLALDDMLEARGRARRARSSPTASPSGRCPPTWKPRTSSSTCAIPPRARPRRALLRILAQGRPTILSDLEHWADIPDDAVVRVDVTEEEGAVTRALLQLAGDARAAPAPRRAGPAPSWSASTHPRLAAPGYETAIAMAAAWPDPPARTWPAHWRPIEE